MKFLFHIIIGFIALAIGLFIYLNYWPEINSEVFGVENQYKIYIGDQVVRVTVADTLDERIQGLSGVASLSDLEGKLFIFDQNDYHGIWMKDMLFPIDIVWINDDLEVVHIESNVQPDTYPEIFAPDEPARFVFEANAFFADVFKLRIGDRVNLPAEILPSDIKHKLLQ